MWLCGLDSAAQAGASNTTALTSQAACGPGGWNFQQCLRLASQIHVKYIYIYSVLTDREFGDQRQGALGLNRP